MGSVWNDGVEVCRLCVNEVTLLGLQDGLFLYFEAFGGDVLGYRWQQCFQELVQEYHVIKIDIVQGATLPLLMDVVGYVGRNVLEER